MHIKSLAITSFRNITNLKVNFPVGVSILYGSNGSGKTNLLEAIFVGCLGRSQRTATDVVMVQRHDDLYRIETEIIIKGKHNIVAVAYQRGGRKHILIDNLPIKAKELYNTFCAVSIGPEDSEILSGSPSVRRTFIDIYLSQFSEKYIEHLVDYARAISQKNAALKAEMDLSLFDAIIVSHGSEIIKARCDFIGKLGQLAGNFYRDISGGGKLGVHYHPSIGDVSGCDSIETIKECFQMKLAASAEREKAIRMALVGPHRDEIFFEICGLPARTHGSQGEWRTAAVSLKLAVFQLLKERRGIAPVLLLDEVFAELDEERSVSLVNAFGEMGQVFLTTATDPPSFLREHSKGYRVNQGTIEAVY